MKEVKDILMIARSLLSRTRRVDEKDNLQRVFGEAIRNGDTVEFLYTKKNGSKKKREITPTTVFRMKGRPAVRGIEVNDHRGIEKLFYLDMIGNVQGKKEIKESIVFRGNEDERKIKHMLEKAVKGKIEVSFDYAVRSNGVWKKESISGIPSKLSKNTRRNGWSVDIGDIQIPLLIIGDKRVVVDRYEELEQKELRAKDMLKELINTIPLIGWYWTEGGALGKKDEIREVWIAMNSGEALKHTMAMGVERQVLQGPYGAMEKSQVVEVKTYMDIKSGKPWDKNRVKIRSEEGNPYWIDDEGNSSRRGW